MIFCLRYFLSWYLVPQPQKYMFYQMHIQLCHLHSSVDLYLGTHQANYWYRGWRVSVPRQCPEGTLFKFWENLKLDLTLLIVTHCSRPFKYESNKDNDCLDTFNLVSFEIKMSWFTVSNAFFRSKNTAATTCPWSRKCLIFSVKKQVADSVKWLRLNPNCRGCK